VAAITYMDKLDFSEPKALSTFRYPEVHPKFPYREFLDGCDLNMPQVYWMQASNSEEQLVECLNQYAKFDDTPIIPTGSAFCEHGWCATSGEVNRFSRKVQELELQGVNYWEWAATRNAGLWPVVRDFVWEETEPPVEPPPVDCCEHGHPVIADALLEHEDSINELNVDCGAILACTQTNAAEIEGLRSRIYESEKEVIRIEEESDKFVGEVAVEFDNVQKQISGMDEANIEFANEITKRLDELESKQKLDKQGLENGISHGFHEVWDKLHDLENKTIPQTNHSHWWQRLFK